MIDLKPVNAEPWWNGCEEAGKHQDRSGPHFNTSVIIHTTENAIGGKAKNVADWQNRKKNRYSGYHLLVDCDGFYEFADPLTSRMYHAGKSIIVPPRTAGASNDIGMSLVAFASKWREADKVRVESIMEEAAKCCAYLSQTYHIPLEHISREQYASSIKGFLGHEEVALPKGRKSDPGMLTGFKWDTLMTRAREIVDGGRVKTVKRTPLLSVKDREFLSDTAQNLLANKANSRSLVYNLRFYRQVAARAGIDGSKPEDVANWIMDRLQDDGK